MQVELLKQILYLVFYNATSESSVQKLSVCAARVWFIPYLNMQASYNYAVTILPTQHPQYKDGPATCG